MKLNLLGQIQARLRRSEIYSKPDFWDAKAEHYQDAAISMWANPHVNLRYHQEQWTFIASCLPERRGLHILDLGCGTGRICRELARAGAEVTGVDFSSRTLEIARRASEGLPIRYIQASIFALPKERKFDAVISTGVLTVACQDIFAAFLALGAIRDQLKLGGSLIVLEPFHRGPLRRVLPLSGSEFLHLLSLAGFEVQRVEPLHFWPTRLALAYVNWGGPLTRGGLRLGEFCLRLFRSRFWGDYHAILATKGEMS